MSAKSTRIRPGTKFARVLAFLARGGELTRFDAERIGDHVLPSTVTEIERRGIPVQRTPVVLRGRFGAVRCLRYWIEPGERKRARSLLRGLG